jgi:hypothetical protein
LQNENKKVMILEWIHRWKRSYMKKVKKRFSDALEWYLDYSFVHLVITVPRMGDIAYYMRLLKKAWKNLHDFLVKKRGRFEFVTVLEPHKDGFPHLHILLFCNWFLINQKELSDYLKSKGVGEVVYIKRYWANRYGKKPIFYLMKYLSKYWRKEDWSEGFLIFSAFLWRSRTRTFSSSRGFFGVLDRGKNIKIWTLWFVSDYDEVYRVLNEGNISENDVYDFVWDGG